MINAAIAERQARFSAGFAAATEAAGGACPIESGLILHLADHECRHGRLPSDRSPACGCWPGEAKPTPDLMTTLKEAKAEAEATKPDVLTLVLADFDREIKRLTKARDELRKLAA